MENRETAANPNEVLAEAAGREITRREVEARLRLSGAWQEAIAELCLESAVVTLAEKEGLSVSDEPLQQAFDDFRRSRGLHKKEETTAWLEAAGLAVEDVERLVEAGLLHGQLAEQLVDDGQVDAFYNQNPQQFEYARVSHLIVAEEGAAQELALSVREEGEDFGKLAREHSLDESTRAGGGFIGLITRADAAAFPPEIADRLFSASVGEVVGPFPVAGGGYCLLRVDEVGRRPLDDELRRSLRAELLGQKMSDS